MAITLIVLSVFALAGLIAAAAYNPVAPAAGAALNGFQTWWAGHRAGMQKGFGWAFGGFITLAILVGILTWVFNFPLNVLAVIALWLAVAAFIVLALGYILGWTFVKWLARFAVVLGIVVIAVSLGPVFGIKLPALQSQSAAASAPALTAEQVQTMINDNNATLLSQIKDLIPTVVPAGITIATNQSITKTTDAQSTGTTYVVDGKNVKVYGVDGTTLLAELTFDVDAPSEWLKDRPVNYLFQSGVHREATVKVTLYEGAAMAADGDWFKVGSEEIGIKDNASDAIIFADAPGSFEFTGSSFGLAIAPWNGEKDKAGNVLTDRRNADNWDGRPAYYLEPDGTVTELK